MWAGDLAPDHANLRSPDLTLGSVDECDLLSGIEAIIELDRGSSIDAIYGRGIYLAALVSSTPSSLIKL